MIDITPHSTQRKKGPWWAIGGFGALALIELLISANIRVLQWAPASSIWLRNHEFAFQEVLKFLRAGLWLLVTYYLAGSGSPRAFVQEVQLACPPTRQAFYGMALAAAIGGMDLFAANRRWTAPHPASSWFYQRGQLGLFLFVTFVTTVGPFYQETVFRGFLYPSLRRSWPPILSKALAICMTAYFSFGVLTRSAASAACLCALWWLLCEIKEKTGNTWNCVLASASYNLIVTNYRPVQMSVAAIVILSLVIRKMRGNSPRAPSRACAAD